LLGRTRRSTEARCDHHDSDDIIVLEAILLVRRTPLLDHEVLVVLERRDVRPAHGAAGVVDDADVHRCVATTQHVAAQHHEKDRRPAAIAVVDHAT